MKKFLQIFAQLIFVSAISVVPVYAQTVTQTPKQLRQEARITAQQERLDTRVTNLKSRADKEIDRRIAALNTVTSKLSGIKHLTDTQKSNFATQTQTEISTLTTLKTKIDADIDITTLRTDVQSIVKEYRVFALFIPQLQLIAAGDKVLNVVDQLTDITTKLQTRISQAQTAGQNVTALQTNLTDMQNKIADAKTQATNAISSVAGLTPAGYPGNRSTLQDSRKMLQTARLDLVTAAKDAKTIIQGLKLMKVTPSVTPAPTQ